MKCYRISIIGEVKNKFFQFAAMEKAYQFGVRGFVRRPKENSVFLEAEGEEDALTKYIEWCKRGPYGSHIREVSYSEKELCNYSSFDYR